jgi:cytochrome c553
MRPKKEKSMTRSMVLAAAVALAGMTAPALAAGDAAAGKAKSAACAMCHGPNGEGTAMAPKLTGKSAADLGQAMQDYKSGKKDNAMMKSQAASLSADDIANLAAYYASIK